MRKVNPWLGTVQKTVTPTKHFLSNLSKAVRATQFKKFVKWVRPTPKTKVLDVGVTSDETLSDSNMFEKLYMWPEKLTAATIEDSRKFRYLYPKIKTVKIYQHRNLPFGANSFDAVVSWATLEHVGGYKQQQDFINELLRVGKKVFITTPFRGAIYEPHTGFFFLHWLPLNWFRKICGFTNRKFWSTEHNLNPLLISDLQKMKFRRKAKFKIFKTFNFFPSHIIIVA